VADILLTGGVGVNSMLTLFTIPANALASSTAYIGDLITDSGPFVWLAIGIPLGFYVIKKVIGLLPKR
jgi:hypothetical protein